ncbi:MAG: tetratricopeptide repeat protein [Desulfuromonadales bacterium]|nr:tetratricopeptide repeat protein [Desulfuromonadales bacterium]
MLPVTKIEEICRRWGLLIIVVVTCLIYANTLDNEFVLDDNAYIQDNYLLRDLRNLPLFFNVPADALVEDLAPGLLRGRNVRWVTYAVDFALGGGAPWMFHLSNLLWHAATGIVLFFLFRRWLLSSRTALLGALLFIAHPIQTNAVAYISGRKDILAAFFLCAALLAVYRYRQTHNYWWFPAILGLFFLAGFSKESAVVFPVLLVLADWCLMKNSAAIAAAQRCITLYWREYLWCFFLVTLYLWWRLGATLAPKMAAVFGTSAPVLANHLASPALADGNLSYANLQLFYLSKLLWPTRLLADYKGVFDFSLYPASYGTVASGIFVIVLVACLIAIRQRAPLITLGLGWIIIALLPVSHLVDFHYPVAEHYLYLPCVGFALSVGSVAELRWRGDRLWSLLLVGLVLCFALATVQRNLVWQNMETITLDILRKAPHHQRARNSLVDVYAKQGKYPAALEQALISLAENPRSAVNNYNLGFLYENLKDYQQAKSYYRRAIMLHPRLWSAYLNLGNLLLEQGDERAGLAVIRDLNSRYGYHPLSYFVTGTHRARQKRWSAALAEFERGLSLDADAGLLKLGVAVALWSLDREPAQVSRLFAEARAAKALETVDTAQPPWDAFFSQQEFRTVMESGKDYQ